MQVLTLDELEQSYHENHVDGTPVNGIYHYVLINKLLEIFATHGLQPEVQEVFAANNRDSQRPGVTVLPAVEERDGRGAVSAHLLRRVYANIALRADESDDVVTNVGVAYHQRGIQIAIGPMVKVCHNQCIMGRPDVAANYNCFNGDTRLAAEQRTIAHLTATAEQWAQNYEAQNMERTRLCSAMASRMFGPAELYTLLGIFTEQRVRHDTSHRNLRSPMAAYPLNSAQINDVCEATLLKMLGERDMTWWDAYQCANSVLKPDRMDIPSVLPQQLALIDTLKTCMNAE